MKLREASSKGMDDHLAEVARKLSALRRLGFDDDQIRDQVIQARDYVIAAWSEKRVKSGKLTEDEADGISATSMPPGAFARNLAAALAKRVEWAKRDTTSGKLSLPSRSNGQEPRSATKRDRELAALEANPFWSVGKTNATNADLHDLCEEFPDVPPHRVRRFLVDAYANSVVSASDVVSLSDVLEDARNDIRTYMAEQKDSVTATDEEVGSDDGPPSGHADPA